MPDPGQPPVQGVPKIRFSQPGIGPGADPAGDAAPPSEQRLHAIPAAPAHDGSVEPRASVIGSNKIRTFGPTSRHEENWARQPVVTGQGASHVRTFHCKLTDDSLAYMDQQINEWLDAHPEYEVKFVTTSIGEFTGKLREPNLICQVWV